MQNLSSSESFGPVTTSPLLTKLGCSCCAICDVTVLPPFSETVLMHCV